MIPLLKGYLVLFYSAQSARRDGRSCEPEKNWRSYSLRSKLPGACLGPVLYEDKMIIRCPDVLRSRTVSAQPQHPFYSSQIEAFGKVFVFVWYSRRYRNGTIWRLVLPDGFIPIAFWLVGILQSQMGTHFKRAETKTQLSCPLIDFVDGTAARKAQIHDGKFHSFHDVSRSGNPEKITGEESVCVSVHQDSVLRERLDEIVLREAAEVYHSEVGAAIGVCRFHFLVETICHFDWILRSSAASLYALRPLALKLAGVYLVNPRLGFVM